MTRKLLPLAILPLLAVLLAAGCMGLGAAAVAGGIVYYKSSHHESATVNLQAQPDRVYQAALDNISANPKLKIAKQDAAQRLIEVKQGKQDITVKITAPASLPSRRGVALKTFSLALASDTNVQYSTLRIVGTGVAIKKDTVRAVTGVPPTRTATEVGATTNCGPRGAR